MSILLRRHCREPIHESDDTCPHCGGEQPESPGQPPQPNLELLPIFRTPDAGLIALAKSLLEGKGIEYMARGDGLQDLLGWGRIAGFNPAVGPVEFVVRSDDAPRARALLRDLARRGQGQSGEPFMMLRSTRPAVVARWLGAGACVAAAGSLGTVALGGAPGIAQTGSGMGVEYVVVATSKRR